MRVPPNLEYLTEVLSGASAPAMPAMEMDENQIEALYAYLVNTAWRAYEKTMQIGKGTATDKNPHMLIFELGYLTTLLGIARGQLFSCLSQRSLN